MSEPIRGRGSSENPVNRFTDRHLEYSPDNETGQIPRPPTQYLRDHTKNVISTNNSPDIPFDISLNPYRGCEHGCVYCYARPTHEFLGFSAGLDFESKIVVKYEAPELLRKTLSDKKWKPRTLVMSGVTDPYQPVEKKLGITRQCVGILAETLHPLVIITKNYLVTRDIDHLKKLAEVRAVRVVISVTSLNNRVTATMEPRTSRPKKRLKAIEDLTEAGIPVHVNLAPLIPGLTDEEMVPLLNAAADAGAKSASYIILRLPYGVKDLFVKWLGDHFPERKEKVLNRLMEMKGGVLNRKEFGERFQSVGPYDEQFRQLFEIHSRRLGLQKNRAEPENHHFKRPENGQLRLF